MLGGIWICCRWYDKRILNFWIDTINFEKQRVTIRWRYCSSMKRYPEYKDSGVEWIGKIPRHWEMVRSKSLFGNRNDRSHLDEPLLSVTQDRGILPRDDLDYRVWNPNENIRSYKLVNPGDWVISLRSFEGGIELSEVRGIVSPAYTTMFSRRKIFSSYFKHLLKSVRFVDELNRITTGIRQGKNIAYANFSETRVTLPPIDEQIAIGTFLDRKTKKIDKLIRAKERKIELLGEYRASLINQAVTKGLDPNVEMKLSKLAWIGKIPCNWKTTKIKYLTENLDGKRIPLSGEVRSGQKRTYPYYGANGVIDYVEDYIFEGDYVLIGEDGAPFFDKKKDVSFLANGKFWVNNHCHVLRNIGASEARFVVYCLNAVDYAHYITGSTRDKLTQADLNRIEIPMPSLPEQVQIADFLDEKIGQTDELRSNEERMVKLLKEYRQSLISEVVTGKIDVRGEV